MKKSLLLQRFSFENQCLGRFMRIAFLFFLMIPFSMQLSHAQNNKPTSEAEIDSMIQVYVKNGISKEQAEKRVRSLMNSKNKSGLGLRSGSRGAEPTAGSIHINRNSNYLSYSPEEFVRNLFINTGGSSCGTEGNVMNVTYRGVAWENGNWTATDRSLAYFSHGGTTPIGIDSGLIMATGGALLAEGKNYGTGTLGGPVIPVQTDIDLNGLIPGYNLFGMSVLEFDFIPMQTEISFDYVFASEEYPEWVGSSYNDVFGFFISGPGIPGGKQNIALIPGTNTPVAINNVNNGHRASENAPDSPLTDPEKYPPINSEYYIANYNTPPGDYVEYDGHTTVLTARATVIPGQVYHMKLAIANAGDNALGSGVFLKGGSFDLGLGITNYGNNIKAMDNVFEGCTNNKFVIAMNASTSPRTVNLSYSGTAVNDLKQLDGSNLPSSIVFPANTTTFEIPYKVLSPIAQNGSNFTISASVPGCGNPWTKTINVYSKPSVTTFVNPGCVEGSGNTMGISSISGGSPALQMSIDGGATWQSAYNYQYTNLIPKNYTLLVRDSVSCTVTSIPLLMPKPEKPDLNIKGGNICPGSSAQLTASSSLANPIFRWYTDPGKANLLYEGSTFTTPVLFATTTYYVEVSGKGSECVGGTIARVAVVPDAMYWSKNAVNSDWNNPANWANALGTILNAVPKACTDVHIPGNASYYPSLDDVHTPRGEYGNPACRNITIHFGGEVANTNYLSYEKAYVLYNFGYYNGNNSTRLTDGDPYSAQAMDRGRWYALAAPLKKMASGDFAVGGFPNMWQRAFKQTQTSGTFQGGFYDPDNNNARELGPDQNYAISIWAGEYSNSELGLDDQKNLNGLKGILQMPYFEDPAINSLHRLHSYSNGTSSFEYYYSGQAGLPPAGSFGTLQRGQESYRFIYEGNLTTTLINDKSQSVFKMQVPANKEIMIGNPFVSSLDFEQFYKLNSGKLNPYYRLYTGSGWSEYAIGGVSSGGLTNEIAALQGFFISTLGGGGTVELWFPIESVSVTRTPGSAHQLKSSTQSAGEELHIKVSNEHGANFMTLALNGEKKANVRKLFSTEKADVKSPQVYAIDKKNFKNALQYEGTGNLSIPLGVKADANGLIKMTFDMDASKFSKISVLDVTTGKSEDVTATKAFSFMNDRDISDRFMLEIVRNNAPTGISDVVAETRIYTSNNVLHVLSNSSIQGVKVMTVQGVQVLSDEGLSVTSYTKPLELPNGIYLVSVSNSDGSTKTAKIVVKN